MTTTSAAVPERGPHGPTDAYRDRSGSAVDELLGPDGGPRAAVGDLAATIDLLGMPGLLARRAEAARLVEDEGVTYGTAQAVGDGEPLRSAPARWKVDPLPVVLDAAAWADLRRGVVQRADLLDRLLTDLYGPRELLRRGVLPPEVVLGHSGFLRQADGIRLPGSRQLFLVATDVARDGDGTWRVIGDRTQAPSGAGYAMQNRRIVSRVMPGLYRDARLQRLRTFFHTVRAALQEVAPATAEAPRVVLLTPGPHSETAFDQAFLSILLGYPLVTGEELEVRGGRVFMRSMGRMEPVDVVLRRVDAWFADPLELRPDSRLGVPGLVEAGRRGTVSVVNPFGAGVLENPALTPFLPAVARALIDEDLALTSPTTWWCGQDADRRHVLAHLEHLVLKPVSRGVGRSSRFGWELSRRQREELRRRIEADPSAWCAQEPLDMSTAPLVTSAGLSARALTLRTFAVAHGGTYQVLDGGLARVAGRPGSRLVSNAAGAVAKDVWVLAPNEDDDAVRTLVAVPPATAQAGHGATSGAGETLPAPALGGGTLASAGSALSPRAAEDLFWLGRYAERAEDAVRLLRVVDDLAEDWSARPGTAGAAGLHVMLEALTYVTATRPGFLGDDPDAASRRAAPHAELFDLVVDGTRPGTLAHAVRRTVEAAHAVREQLSLDTWIVLGSLDRVLDELVRRRDATGPSEGVATALQPSLARVLEGFLALAGLGAESMVRDAGWHFLDAGRRLERALQVVSLLRGALASEHPAAVDSLVLESVLIAGESIITHRRRHQGRARVPSVVALLVLDRENPRSVALQLDRLAEDLRHLPDPGPARGAGRGAGPDPAERLREVTARLREIDPERDARTVDGRRPHLVAVLDALTAGLQDLATSIELTHFAPLAPPRPIAATPGWDA